MTLQENREEQMKKEITIISHFATGWLEESPDESPYDTDTFKTTLAAAGINSGQEAEAILEDIFRAFNRVDESDVDRLNRIGYRLPSLSVGDTVILDQKVYEVKNLGFEEIKQATV